MEQYETLSAADVLSYLYKPTIGSISYSLNETAALVGPDPEQVDDPLLRRRLDAALPIVEEAMVKYFLWRNRKRKKPLQRQGVMEADNEADRAARNFYDYLDVMCRLPASSPLRPIAISLRDATMPEGVGVITRQTFENQHASTDVILRILDERHKDVKKLNLGPFVDALREANQVYGQRLRSTNAEGVTHAQVQAAYRQALDAFCGVVLTIWSNYLEDPDTRNKLLAVIHEQNERIAEYYKNNSKAPEVDPDSGEFFEPADDESTADDEPTADGEPTADDDAQPTADDTPTPVSPLPVEDPA